MEVPILQACDTTEGWEKGDTALGESELAIEFAGERNDGSLIKHLLVGDGRPVGPNAKRLRAKFDLIAELPGKFAEIKAAIDAEVQARIQGDKELAAAISAEEKARIHGDEELAAAIGVEAQARIQGDKELSKVDKALADDIASLRNLLEAYNAAVNYLILFIESKFGPLGGRRALKTQSGQYLITQSGAYLVTAK